MAARDGPTGADVVRFLSNRWPGTVGWLLTLLLLLGGIAPGQNAKPSGDTPPGFQIKPRERKISTLEMLKEFEGPAEEGYRLGEGDEITLEFWGRPELSGKHTVGPDGTVTLPLVGTVKFTGLSREEAAGAAVKALANYYADLTATVRVDRYTSNRVFILGRVSSPGMLSFETPPTLLEALTRAGSLPVGGVGAEKAALSRCTIFRGSDMIAWVDLKKLLAEGNLAYNLRLKKNDIIYIPDSDTQLIYVLGEVKSPGAYRLTPDMSFIDAIGQAGGITNDAVPQKIQVIRIQGGLNAEIDLRDLLKPNGKINLALEEGDVIFIPRRRLARAGYVFEKINPFLSLLVISRTLLR